MSKNINFRARSKTEFEIQLKPYPAVKQLPEWFVKSSPHWGSHIFPQDGKLHFRNREANNTYKKCVPLLDSLSAGYIIPLWADVMVEQRDGFPEIYWKTQKDIFQLHGQPSREFGAAANFSDSVANKSGKSVSLSRVS